MQHCYTQFLHDCVTLGVRAAFRGTGRRGGALRYSLGQGSGDTITLNQGMLVVAQLARSSI
jgi:hypothetical protein